MWRYSEKVDLCKPGKEPLSRIKFYSTLILGFPLSRTLRSQCLLLMLLTLWYFVIAVWVDSEFYSSFCFFLELQWDEYYLYIYIFSRIMYVPKTFLRLCSSDCIISTVLYSSSLIFLSSGCWVYPLSNISVAVFFISKISIFLYIWFLWDYLLLQ